MAARFYIENGTIADFDKNQDLILPFLSKNFHLTEKIWFCHNELPLFDKHISALKEKVKLIKLPGILILEDPKEVLRISKRLINKNKAFKSGILEYNFIWNIDKVDTYITCFPKDFGNFPLLQNGVLCSFSTQVKYSYDTLRNFYNEVLWNTLKWQIKESRFQNLIILNENKFITECIGANIYFIKGNILTTPSEETGCYLDPLREFILESARSLNLKINENPVIKQESILKMDEAFLASEDMLMQKVSGINDKRFIHNKTALINKQLNKLLEIN